MSSENNWWSSDDLSNLSYDPNNNVVLANGVPLTMGGVVGTTTAAASTTLLEDMLKTRPVKVQVVLHPKEEGDDPPIIDIEVPAGSFLRVNFVSGTVTLQAPDGSKPRLFDRDTGQEIEHHDA